jgi:hypothetical protein
VKTKTAISLLILSVFAMGAAQAESFNNDSAVHVGHRHGRTTSDDISNIPFGGTHGQSENGLTREQVLAELRDAPRPGPFDELPLGQGDSGTF